MAARKRSLRGVTTLKDLARAELAKLEQKHPERARAAEEPTHGQALRGVHLRAAEVAALEALVRDLGVSPSVAVGRALLALAAARGLAKGGR